ncbi:class I adenylate-forming enzyme family protein [Spirulina sp. 06S082]|uniref:class I adenylate-forming enzyme family protein n=1 Tax=Spirulina sp. 06S082 TaxID=3110248 RepID=UPI003A4D2CBC
MNIAQNVERGAKFVPNKSAILFESKTFTYQELNERVNRAANGLRTLGVSKGDRVALFLPNIPEFVFVYLGIQKLGAIAVSISAALKSDEVKFILNDCTASVIVTTEELVQNVPIDDLAYLQHILIAEGETTVGKSLATLMAASSPELQAAKMERDDPAAILYTSGTTGFPKGAVLSHGNVISNMYSVNYSCGMRNDDKLLLYLPLFHCFGQNFILNAGLNACATIVLQRRFDPEKVFEAITREKITMFFGVPTVFIRMLEMFPDYDFSSIRFNFSAAAPMSPEIVRRWQKKHGQVIYEGYGLTETSPFAAYNHPMQYKFGSVGMPIPNVEMKVVDEEDKEVSLGEVGELVIRGPNVMLGYWKRPEVNAEVIKNGWFYTGDLGWMDEDGYFYIADRLKDMINLSGFKVYPSEVERVFYQHPEVSEVAVYGVPHPTKGEMVKANVCLKEGCSVTVEELQAFCEEHIANYKVPKVIELVTSFPKNPTGKILKRVLRQQNIRKIASKNKPVAFAN